MKNYILRYGLYGGSVSIVLGLINWFTISQVYGPGVSQIVGYLGIILSLMCVPLGITYYREKLNDGNVSLGEAFKIGIKISFVASIIIFFYGMLFFVLAGDSFNEWNQQGLSEVELKELQLRMEQTPGFVLTPWFQGLILGLSVFLIGLIISLVSAIALKRSAAA